MKAETLLGISGDFVINLGVVSLIAIEVIVFHLRNHVLSFLKRYILLLLLPPFGKLNSPEERRRGQFGLWLLLFLRVVRTVSACIRVTAIFGFSILLIEFQQTRDVTQLHDTSHDRVK